MAEPTRREQQTIGFLQMAAVELRRLAERAPEIAVHLQHVATQLDKEADDLSTPKTP